MSGLNLYLLDQSPEMVAIAQANVSEHATTGKVEIMQGDVAAIPLPEQSVDLVVSRGSIPFWKDLPAAFCEIYRVLKPGGFACVGGGLGTAEMRKKILSEMQNFDPKWSKGKDSNIPHHPESHYTDALQVAAIPGATIIRGEAGTWVEFRK
jgi:ubiquinone/menaquinone biosynthesis C-methylase UbiE